ncbi:3-phosphoshikimate 1-carboxyvinyltransferase [Helicobacter cappadocius]|uniref:3-phosphoshikimate 1-carboxyvinyltransferase n=1 Tax=Helicobacter cappadocius TaxID=3063998 RepID=A0AA90PXX7_9HELI|nr:MULTISPECIES: 3-phosphoshikimate 1-carboxyvinyltransferase [unclassified Helicobacter]MDO7252681.1 3-phosphoshikimate 1-carboxyvinyltransferase [Helicobacter sp. faydin-H75]MDP2538548.1 3-phosphoshikimate 1-carboxyvinyltransferase [Helicobacter sp. faydin-H76]
MRTTEVFMTKKFELELENIASDKSISHRCAIFSLLSNKPSVVKNYLLGEDTLNTIKIAKQLGLQVEEITQNQMKFTPPKEKIQEPNDILDCGNAGTAIRLYAGLLCAQEGYFVLTGDKYLKVRPMKRVIEPLTNIGAKIYARKQDSLAPMTIIGQKLKGFDYQSPISSAQIKSAMILAALNTNQISKFKEPELSRDHTENILKGMGANIKNTTDGIEIFPLQHPLDPLNINIPSDPSSAFFFAIAAAIVPNSKVLLKNVLLNKTRIEAFKILEKMGAKIQYTITNKDYEDIGNIYVEQRPLQGVDVEENISWLIDEIPALSIAMAVAKGKSRIKNAQELRVKETDRIKAVITNLKKMGIECEEFEDGYSIEGGELKFGILDSYGDHRIAMSFAIAGLLNGSKIKDSECIDVSFPNFLEILQKITNIQNQ